jgi:tetratricopeptide (TPR) repeat protein
MHRYSSLVLVLLVGFVAQRADAGQANNSAVRQTTADPGPQLDASSSPLGVSPEVQKALDDRDYPKAEALLLADIEHAPASLHSRNDLIVLANIFFRDAKYLNAAIAWSKAEAISPLDDSSRFSLAMADLEIDRPEWARKELEQLAHKDPGTAIYEYWLARLDYDAQQYNAAIARLQQVIKIDPDMSRAYDRLGLCYDYLGKLDDAIAAYQHAVTLNRNQPHPSPWPHVDFAVSLMEEGRVLEAIAELQEAISYDSRLPQAYYQLGLALETAERPDEARAALQHAIALDPTYPEPHYALVRIYSKEGRKEDAAAEVKHFQQLKSAQASSSVHPTSLRP